MKGAIHIGTSGWSYKHWREIFYPAEVKPPEYLSYYSTHFDTVEINTSFYHLPKEKTVQHWAEVVKKGFYFCPKISRYVTHIKKLNDPQDTFPPFFALFEDVKSRLGPVLIQLPPSLAFHEEKAIEFYSALKKYKGFHFALEPRHASWLSEQSIALMKKNHVAFVIADSGGRWPSGEFITDRHVYIRFHGPGNYDISYTEEFLQKYAGKISAWKKDNRKIWAFFNNDGHGFAIRNARKLIALIEKV